MNLYNLTTFLKFYYFFKQVSPLWTWPCSIAKIGSNKMFKQAKNNHIITILVTGSAEEVPALVISLRSLCCRSISEQSRRHSILQSRRSRQWIFIPYPFRTNTNAGLSLSPISVLSLTSPSLHQTPPGCHEAIHIVCFDWQICAEFLLNDSREESRRPSGRESSIPSVHRRTPVDAARVDDKLIQWVDVDWWPPWLSEIVESKELVDCYTIRGRD